MADPPYYSTLLSLSATPSDLPSETIRFAMKEASSSTKVHRNAGAAYPKKRPSPHGVHKNPKSASLLPADGLARRTPRPTKYASIQQKEREARIQALRREGIILEEEYRDDIREYMYQMEVRHKRVPYPPAKS